MFSWFKPKNKKNVVVPTFSNKQLHGIELIAAFTTEDEPKLFQYPKTKYKVYWETVLATVSGGYTALVRFYEYDSGKVVKEKLFGATSVEELKAEVVNEILTTLKSNVR